MSIKTAVATVLKTVRKARGLTQKDLAEVSSRTYVSKLERGQSSPTLEMMATLSAPLRLSPLTLVAITIGTETGQPIESLLDQMEKELAELTTAGLLLQLQIPSKGSSPMKRLKAGSAVSNATKTSQQAEFCFEG